MHQADRDWPATAPRAMGSLARVVDDITPVLLKPGIELACCISVDVLKCRMMHRHGLVVLPNERSRQGP